MNLPELLLIYLTVTTSTKTFPQLVHRGRLGKLFTELPSFF